jgi:para-aminobenzoate synthetase / 4-amino-4-deoxychorismate lyase
LLARTPAEVMPLLAAVQHGVDQGYYAAGFLSYEAAPAFDASFVVQPCEDFPLAWFGLYPEPTVCPSLPDLEDVSSHGPFAEGLSPDRESPDCVSLDWSPDISRDRYHHAICQIKAAIAQGRTYQVNYSFRLRSPWQADPFRYFRQLIQAQQAQYGAFIDLGEWVICCASPELFFDWYDGLLTSRPMKGTAARGLTYARDRAMAQALRQSSKNQAENVMIVDMIRNDMGRIAQLGTVQVPRLFDIEQYPTLWQMTSPVQCRTTAALPDLMQALFPCASITGAPKSSTMGIIADLETSPRRIYTGTIGFMTPQRTAQFNVAIRTVLINMVDHRAEYGVGGGIVWDSEAADEYDECCTKTKVLTQQRPGFDLLETLLWEPTSGYFLLDLHLQRLQQSAAYFGFPMDRAAIEQHLRHLATPWQTPQRVRLTLAATGQLTHQAIAHAATSDPVRIGICPFPVDPNNVFLYHKTTHRCIYTQAQQARPDAEDVLLWNPQGEITESCIGNLVAEWQGQLYTPPVDCGLLAGTYRQWLLHQGKLQERVIRLDDLPNCTQLWRINSVRQWQPILLVH